MEVAKNTGRIVTDSGEVRIVVRLEGPAANLSDRAKLEVYLAVLNTYSAEVARLERGDRGMLEVFAEGGGTRHIPEDAAGPFV
jgi:hypothetical protein